MFGVIWQAAPYFLPVPIYFSGHIAFGAIAQSTLAANQILNSLSLITDIIPQLSAAAPQAVRLAEIQERFDALDGERRDTTDSRIALTCGEQIVLTNVSLSTPGGERSLVQDLSLTLSAGKHLIILGHTGGGKSSVLRAMAGLWDRGKDQLKCHVQATVCSCPKSLI